MTDSAERRFYVTWRHPSDDVRPLIRPVGLLTQRVHADGPRYRFVYLKHAEQLEGFRELPGLPDLHRVYESDDLFATFAIRLMPRERPDYGDYLRELHIDDPETDPLDVMARNEGRRMTDWTEVFSEPTLTRHGDLTTTFFARGVRHVPGAPRAIAEVRAGDELRLVDEPDNPADPRAVLISTRTGGQVGYVPDYLIDMIAELRELAGADAVDVTAEHVNPPTSAPQMRLLCRLTSPWPEGYQPFSGPDFQPIVESGDLVSPVS